MLLIDVERLRAWCPHTSCGAAARRSRFGICPRKSGNDKGLLEDGLQSLGSESLLPKLLTASRKVVIYNGVWSAVPDLRPMMLRTSRSNHVIVCDSGLPELRQLRQAVTPRITILHVEQSKQKKGAIRVSVRTVRRPRKKAAR